MSLRNGPDTCRPQPKLTALHVGSCGLSRLRQSPSAPPAVTCHVGAESAQWPHCLHKEQGAGRAEPCPTSETQLLPSPEGPGLRSQKTPKDLHICVGGCCPSRERPCTSPGPNLYCRIIDAHTPRHSHGDHSCSRNPHPPGSRTSEGEGHPEKRSACNTRPLRR